jgi:hypothetical protein
MPGTSNWLSHTRSTDPASFGPQIALLRSDIVSLNESIQKLLVHTDCLTLYDIDTSSMTNISRATLPVQERLRKLAISDHLDFSEGRQPADREVGTCRDFAIFLCSFLRTHGIPARVRCGFASYFGEGWWDHWICEYCLPDTDAWLRADAELDRTVCEAYNITFDTLNMPQGTFLTAGEAWIECRSGRLSPDEFGHGDHKGLWFISMNVARDSLSLNGQEMSPWDTWRKARPEVRQLSHHQLLRVDQLASHPERLPDQLTPPWLMLSSDSQVSN